ncbi:MAG TPA: TauD/TfdA family dioxygenase [Nonomuraea sp.]|nr:TauD/TfdA family dioxygenase [Nonomuraea sp.]
MDRFGLNAIEAWNAREQRRYETIAVKPIAHTIGAEVRGADLRDVSEAQLAEIRQALADHLVLVFRDQTLDQAQHKAFGRQFGELHCHPMNLARGDANPEILEIKADKASKYVAGEGWHSDVTCDAEPPMGSLLYITEMPEAGVGGDTLFANMYLAYDLLSDPMKAMLQGLTAIHDGAIPYQGSYKAKPPEGGFPRSEHPVVTRHPVTGRKVLFVNPGFTSHIVQLSRHESKAVLDMLYRVIEVTPALVCRMPWTPNSLVFWDNRCTQHHSVWDYYPFNRYGQRVTVLGERPEAA